MENIVENNRLIAEFMGFKMAVENHNGINLIENNTGILHDINSLQYNTSWDWLMPVAEKINKEFSKDRNYEGFRIWPDTIYFQLGNKYRSTKVVGKGENRFNSLLEALYISVVEFLIWQKQNHETSSI